MKSVTPWSWLGLCLLFGFLTQLTSCNSCTAQAITGNPNQPSSPGEPVEVGEVALDPQLYELGVDGGSFPGIYAFHYDSGPGVLYLGGSFSYVGRSVGSLIATDKTTGDTSTVNGVSLPPVNGPVNTIIPYHGGWIIGGKFTRVGNQERHNLARILPDGTVASWNPDPDNTVFKVFHAAGYVFVSGAFNIIDGQPIARLAAFDVQPDQSLDLNTWNPNPSDWVKAMAASGSTLFVGGNFATISGQPRTRMAAYDIGVNPPSLLASWAPSANLTVEALAVDSTHVYVGGGFNQVNSQTRNRLARLDKTTGALDTSWDPGADGFVFDILVAGSTLYVGGNFSTIGGHSRTGLAALNASSGALIAGFNPMLASDSGAIGVMALAQDHTDLYFTGAFDQVTGQTRFNAACVSTIDGSPRPWNPNVGNTGQTLTVAADAVILGGRFLTRAGVRRQSLAAVNIQTGQITSWAPSSDGEIYSIVKTGSRIFVAGLFGNIGGESRYSLAELNMAGEATAWDPSPEDEVHRVFLSGGKLFISGFFAELYTNATAVSRQRVASFSLPSLALDPWDPQPNAGVMALTVVGSDVFLGGYFTLVGSQNADYLAKVDLSGTPAAWNPQLDLNVRSLLSLDGTLYVGGEFTQAGTQTRNRLAAFDSSGTLTSWDPDVQGSSMVRINALAASSTRIFVGGRFEQVGGLSRENLAAVDLAGAPLTSWNAPVQSYEQSQLEVRALRLHSGELLVGGVFSMVGNKVRSGLAVLNANTGAVK